MSARHTAIQNILFLMIIISGVTKSFFYSIGLSIDLTLITATLVLCDIIYAFFLKKFNSNINQRILLLFVLIFYMWVIISCFYSPSQSYKFTKSINFSLCILFFIYPLVVKKLYLSKIMSLVKLSIVGLSLFYIYKRTVFWAVENASMRSFDLESFGNSGVYLPLGILLGVVAIYEYYEKKWLWVLINLALIIAIGSRGAFLFTILSIFGFMAFFESKKSIPKRKNNNLIMLFVVFILFGACISNMNLIFDFSDMGINRFTSLISGSDKSSLGRFNQYVYAINMIMASGLTAIFGYGIGSFGLLYQGVDERSYPHNILLEVWFELGLIGLILLCLIIFLGYKSTKMIIIKSILFYLILNLMKSNSFVDAWIFFLFLGVANSKIIIKTNHLA